MMVIDLNADLGEGAGNDAALYPLISSASIACGGHAGDRDSMQQALAACAMHGVVAGAHPGFADRENFGRVRTIEPVAATIDTVLEQVATLLQIAQAEGATVRYLKLHGALANMAAEDEVLAAALFAAVVAEYPKLAILAMAATGQERAARGVGAVVITEAYADRAYTADGQLASRSLRGAVIHDVDTVVARCVRLVQRGEIVALDGSVLRSHAQSICLHGDTREAVTLCRAVHATLSQISRIASPLCLSPA